MPYLRGGKTRGLTWRITKAVPTRWFRFLLQQVRNPFDTPEREREVCFRREGFENQNKFRKWRNVPCPEHEFPASLQRRGWKGNKADRHWRPRATFQGMKLSRRAIGIELSSFPFRDEDFDKLSCHRPVPRGRVEIVFTCWGKTADLCTVVSVQQGSVPREGRGE